MVTEVVEEDQGKAKYKQSIRTDLRADRDQRSNHEAFLVHTDRTMCEQTS